ncbi:acyl-CoA N-acyltransferase [Lipomyces tetrasporus]|uniref:Glucosamine 6-phosphate N-acetyltransferase n=1 Tax=Lipomyces tetrasporus TaxID=54092 RepID=A0AAD7QNU2_9ASCO|nr:acyl-CoA N-acyltransferase [Lipomyces tetrasporus]KAJ8098689.1 acyl-CoA N-acyltransferase [Lipomyces tetrasporus]
MTDANTALFPTSFICPDISSQLGQDYILRPLQLSDYRAGVLEVLKDLTTIGDISEERFTEQFEFLRARQGEYFIIVIEKAATGRVVGVGTLLVERKFIHECGLVGHIEDIAVAKSEQGKRLGIKIIGALDFIGQRAGCYKNILDCSPHNEQFYVKCGYSNAGFEMTKRFDK